MCVSIDENSPEARSEGIDGDQQYTYPEKFIYPVKCSYREEFTSWP